MQVPARLLGGSPKLYAPGAMTGRHLTGWGLPSLKLRGLLPPSDETPGAPSYANQSELRTGKLPHHMLCPLQFVLRPGRKDKETLGCPYDSVPLLVSLAGAKGKEEQYNLRLVPLQKLPEGSAEHLPSALGAPLRSCPVSGASSTARRSEVGLS